MRKIGITGSMLRWEQPLALEFEDPPAQFTNMKDGAPAPQSTLAQTTNGTNMLKYRVMAAKAEAKYNQFNSDQAHTLPDGTVIQIPAAHWLVITNNGTRAEILTPEEFDAVYEQDIRYASEDSFSATVNNLFAEQRFTVQRMNQLAAQIYELQQIIASLQAQPPITTTVTTTP